MLIQADARQIPLVDGCVQCVVTSPPYFGLRDYGHTGQIGLEASPADYLTALVAVFAEVRRVLADDGVLWLNLGDSYAGSWGAHGRPQGDGQMSDRSVVHARQIASHPRFDGLTGTRGRELGMKPKDLMMIPARAALALQADGWYLRSDVIWHKPNPMPESVTDRPTKAHEYLFLLTKSERYFYDAKAIAEPVSDAMLQQVDEGYDGLGLKDYESAGVQNPSSVKARIIAKKRLERGELGSPSQMRSLVSDTGDRYMSGRTHAKHRQSAAQAAGHRMVDNVAAARAAGAPHDAPFGLTRNKRTVWTIPTMPYSGAHFATMPEALVEPCILAGSRFGDLIFDPFSGSGTVLAVAQRLGRRGVGTDLNPAYHALAKKRTAQRGIPFSAQESA